VGPLLTEQLAGDELVDWRSAKKYTPEITEPCRDRLLAHHPRHHRRGYQQPARRALRSALQTRGKGLEQHARTHRRRACCHSHSSTPSLRRTTIVSSALHHGHNPTDWLQPQNRHLYTVSKVDKEADAHNKKLDEPITELKKQLAALRKPYNRGCWMTS
jgi:hypothetical protein